jgi:hypothetical protein
LSGMVVISLSRVIRIDSVDGGWGDWSTPNTPAPIFAAIVRKAATRYVRKRVGSLSPSSSDSQATRTFGSVRSQPATHSLTSVVLPKPAGAEILKCHAKLQPWRSEIPHFIWRARALRFGSCFASYDNLS